MKTKLLIRGLTKYLIGLVLVSLLIFLPAGSIKFVNGWIFIGLLFIPMLIMGIVLFFKAPDLLEKRLNAKETEDEQKKVIALSGIMFLAGFIVAGLDSRFNWVVLPKWIIIVGAIIFLLSYMMYMEVLRENTYLSRTIEVQEEQQVIDTGLYGIVRHPMYSATILMFLSMPIVLGSIVSFFIFLVYPILIVKRIKNEEAVLEQQLNGYSEYKQKVRFRLIPFVW